MAASKRRRSDELCVRLVVPSEASAEVLGRSCSRAVEKSAVEPACLPLLERLVSPMWWHANLSVFVLCRGYLAFVEREELRFFKPRLWRT